MLTKEKPKTVKHLARVVATRNFRFATVPLRKSQIDEAMTLTSRLAIGETILEWQLFHDGRKGIYRPKKMDAETVNRLEQWIAEYKAGYHLLMEEES